MVSVDSRAPPGCGLLTTGERPTDAVAAGAPERYEDCGPAIADGGAVGVAAGPDVVLLVTGACERSDHVRDGRTVGSGDEAWTEGLRRLLSERIATLASRGYGGGPLGRSLRARRGPASPTVVVPERGGRTRGRRDRGRGRRPRRGACAGGRPRAVEGVGDPRPDDGQHWSQAGAAWLWTSWLGPRLAAAGA